MIATIPLATGNKLNCFISARGMLTIVWHCALVLLFCCLFFVDFYMLCNHLLKKTPMLERHSDSAQKSPPHCIPPTTRSKRTRHNPAYNEYYIISPVFEPRFKKTQDVNITGE